MPRLVRSTPKYRKHRASGQAVVSLNGQDVYLGPHGTQSSRAEYDRLVGEWLARGRRSAAGGGGDSDVRVVELIAAFWRHAQTHYARPDGHKGELACFKAALSHLKRLYGPTRVSEFGPLALKAVREAFVDAGWCRKYVNRQTVRVRQVVKWGVSEAMVPGDVLFALQSVTGLKRGKSAAKESEPVKPVPDAHVEAVKRVVSPVVAAMIELQVLTGMRPGECCAMRGRDLDTTGRLWLYRPAAHKTEHHGHDRTVYLGPRAREVLAPFLRLDPAAHLFQPADSEAWRLAARSAARKTPASCGNRPGSNVKRRPSKKAGDRFDVASYRRAIYYACDRAFPPPTDLARQHVQGDRGANSTRLERLPEWRKRLGQRWGEVKAWRDAHQWHPNQLRHNAGTFLRKTYGIEAAQVILGHRTLSVTEIYAEKNVAAAQRIMAEVG